MPISPHKLLAATASDFTAASNIGNRTLNDNLNLGLNILVGIASALALLAFFVGAAQYLAAGGDPAKGEQAKKTLTWAVVGIVALMAFWIILRFVLSDKGGVLR